MQSVTEHIVGPKDLLDVNEFRCGEHAKGLSKQVGGGVPIRPFGKLLSEWHKVTTSALRQN